MGMRELRKLGSDTLRLALLASAELERELTAGEDGDTRRAKELSGNLKDMALLGRELRFEEPQALTVKFVGEAEEMSE